MEIFLEYLHKFSFAGLIALFSFEAIVLLVRGKNNKARKTMAYVLLMWALVYFLTLIRLHISPSADDFPLFRENVEMIGNIYIVFIFFFPVQVLMPGWLNWKRIILMLLPIGVISGLYYVGLAVFDEAPEKLFTYTQLGKSFWNFNVWFRFVMLLNNLVYIFLLLRWLYQQEKRYIHWKNDNFSDQEYVDISWMRTYDVLMLAIVTFYFGSLAIGGRLSVICHTYVVIGAFSYLFYKALFYESPYPEDFFALDNKSSDNKVSNFLFKVEDPAEEEEMKAQGDKSFEDKLSGYIAILKEWMEEEKPYLYKDFKLSDVSRVLPMNRSYQSRVFNDGFGMSFNDVVRNYRVEFSKSLLVKNTSMPLHRVAELSGFHTDVTYIRAFRLVVGMTPKTYRMQFVKEV